MVSIGTLFAFVVVSVAVAVLRRTAPQMHRPFRAPLVPLLPVVSALSCVALMASLAVDTWIRFVVWLVIGLVVYLGYGRRHSVLARTGAGGAVDTTAAGAGR
jgi:APA family basic amino acid/polyamine antiporter